jgi:hypothetical protein
MVRGIRQAGLTIFAITTIATTASAIHNSGKDCLSCHRGYSVAGSVFSTFTAAVPAVDIPVMFLGADGSEIVLDDTDEAGNLHAPDIPDGTYLFNVGNITSRTWHSLPSQGSCNTCHFPGGNDTEESDVVFTDTHARIPIGNTCITCHHFPASMSYSRLHTPGVLNASRAPLPHPGSRVDIGGVWYDFDPAEYDIQSVRPDIFAPGYYSMFDVILAVAEQLGIEIAYHYDPDTACHFIDTIDGVEADYWYHFTYDAGFFNNSIELIYRRAYRWDEALWRPGVEVRVVTGENLAEIRAAYRAEIERERAHGHVISHVNLDISPLDPQLTNSDTSDPVAMDRITVSREWTDVPVSAHDMRATGAGPHISTPFQPGVVTSIDILLSLSDQGELGEVETAFISRIASFYIDSYYVVGLTVPGEGTAHASGSQGFVYLTGNGAPDKLPNGAGRVFHMTSDIRVIHAPEFTKWYWIELGPPYYEREEPNLVTAVADDLLADQYAGLNRGFVLHEPYPNPFNASVTLPFTILDDDPVTVTVYNSAGQTVATLLDSAVRFTGMQNIAWSPDFAASGVYFVVMASGSHRQVRTVTLVK